MAPRQMPTEPELPNIMDPNLRPNINLQPQAVIDISKKHPITYLSSMTIQSHLQT